MKNKLLLSAAASAVLLTALNAETTLDEVTVTTATKTEKSIDGVSASVVVITQEDIEKTGASTLDKVLQQIPSINAQFARFPHPSSASKSAISIRGTGANGTLLLIDGKRLSGETEGPYEMTRIPASLIEKIEIVKGSMSTLYGSDAIGGVINIITKKATQSSTVVDVKYGSNTSGKAKNKNINLTHLGNSGDIRYKLYGSINDTTPYTEKRNYQESGGGAASGSLDVTYRDESMVKTVGGMIEKDFTDNLTAGIDLSYFKEDREGQYIGNARNTVPALVKGTPINSKDENRRTDVTGSVKYQINDDLSLDTKVYRSYYKKRNETDPINFAGPTNTKFSANVTIDAFESNLTYDLNDMNLITTGFEYRKETRDSSAINPNPTSSEFITKEVKYKSLFIQDEIELAEDLNAIIGARYDNISNAENKTTFQVGLVKRFGENTKLRANYATGYRAPDIAELYVVAPVFKDASRYGAEVIFGPKTTAYDLKPEQSKTFEIALSNSFGAFNSEIVLFNSDIKDKIDLVKKTVPATYYTSENLDEVNIKGAEINLDYDVNEMINLAFNTTLLDTKNKQNDKELTYTPDLSANLGANFAITKDLNSYAGVRYISEQFTETDNSAKTDSHVFVDVNVKYQLNKNLEIYAGVDNLFDEEVEIELGTNVGTFIYTGLRVNF